MNVTLISDSLGGRAAADFGQCAESVDHRGGLDAFLAKAKDDELSPKALEIKRAGQEEARRAS